MSRLPTMKWTADANEKLFLLNIKDIKVDTKKLEAAWKEAYPNDDIMPTARAIQEQIAKLKKRAGGATTATGVTPKTTPAKPKAMPASTSAKKTPLSGKRKAKSISASDDDDSEDALAAASCNDNVTPRAKSQRRSKTPKRYRVDSMSADDMKQEDVAGDFFDNGVGGEVGAAGMSSDAMSDISDFAPGA